MNKEEIIKQYILKTKKLSHGIFYKKEQLKQLTTEEVTEIYKQFEEKEKHHLIRSLINIKFPESGITTIKREDGTTLTIKDYEEQFNNNNFDKEELYILLDSSNNKDFYENKALILSKIISRQEHEAIEILTKLIEEKEVFKTTREDNNSEIWIYNKGIYVPNGKTYIKEICRKYLESRYLSIIINEVIKRIEADTFIDKEEFFREQEDYPELLPVENGLLNIKTKELLPFTSKIAFFQKLKVLYNKESKCPNFNKFIKEITSNENEIIVLQEMFGYCLLREYRFEKSFILYGPTGRNGKSKLLNVLKLLFGIENISNVSLDEIEKSPFALSNLHGKMINISADISNSAIKGGGNFRSITGRDLLSANRKNKSYINFVNYAKMIFAANELPPVYVDTDAFWQRWVGIEFKKRFLPQKEIDAIPECERDNVFLQDPEILNKIITPEELEGVLNWSLNGLDRLFVNKDFSTKLTSKDFKRFWFRESNSVAAFILDEIEEDFDNYISKSEFKKRYLNYCRKNNLKTLGDKVIIRTIGNETGAVDKRKMAFVDNNSNNKDYINVWDGIKFRDNTINIPVREGQVTNLLNSSEEYV